jgi:predicted kinase
MKVPTLVAFGGLPGVGKTLLAKAAAVALEAVYLRVDTIEQALRGSGKVPVDLGPAGYMVAYRVAAENLLMGRSVVVDSVNPLAITRDGWLSVARSTSANVIEVEITCSDVAEHRGRVESRTSDIEGLVLLSWEAVITREYEQWLRPHIIIDTAHRSVAEAIAELLNCLRPCK